MRRWFTLILLLLVAAPAQAHMIEGRRPIDALVAKADMAAFVTVVHETAVGTGPTSLRLTTFRTVRCVRGACPRGTFRAAALDDHSADYVDPGRPVFVPFVREPARVPGGGAIEWRIVATAYEARTLAEAAPTDVAAFTTAYARLLELKPDERDQDYVDTLLRQLGAPARWLQEDALQSLLRVPPKRVTPTQTARLLTAAAATPYATIRIGLLLVAETWNAGAMRDALAAAPLDRWEPPVRARSLAFLASGSDAQRALPCRFLEDPDGQVRAAAVGACTPMGGAWIPLVTQALADEDADVRAAARQRLRAHPESRPSVRAWALARMPVWKRWPYRVTGRIAPAESEIFTDVGAANP